MNIFPEAKLVGVILFSFIHTTCCSIDLWSSKRFENFSVVTPPLILEKSTNLIMYIQRQINLLYNSRLGVLEFALSLCDNKIQLLAWLWYDMHELVRSLLCSCWSSSVISVSLKIVQPIGNILEKGLPYLVEILASFSFCSVDMKGVNRPVWTAKRKCF